MLCTTSSVESGKGRQRPPPRSHRTQPLSKVPENTFGKAKVEFKSKYSRMGGRRGTIVASEFFGSMRAAAPATPVLTPAQAKRKAKLEAGDYWPISKLLFNLTINASRCGDFKSLAP